MFEQLVDGIFWVIALWVFAIGVLWRILSIFRVRNKPDYSVQSSLAKPNLMTGKIFLTG